jgi:hypothetical protein
MDLTNLEAVYKEEIVQDLNPHCSGHVDRQHVTQRHLSQQQQKVTFYNNTLQNIRSVKR